MKCGKQVGIIMLICNFESFSFLFLPRPLLPGCPVLVLWNLLISSLSFYAFIFSFSLSFFLGLAWCPCLDFFRFFFFLHLFTSHAQNGNFSFSPPPPSPPLQKGCLLRRLPLCTLPCLALLSSVASSICLSISLGGG